MNRRWPTIATWSLLVATTISAIVSAFTDALLGITAAFAAATGFVWLCQRRYVQHSAGGTFVAMVILGMVFARRVTPVWEMWPEALLAVGLLIGCRGIAESLLRHCKPAKGIHALWLSSAIFGASSFPIQWWIKGGRWADSASESTIICFGAILVGMLTQLAASVWLVKTIPESKQDERPATALWFVLMAWFITNAC